MTEVIFTRYEMKMKHVYNDGGRAEAGYKGYVNDCTCRSIAIATGLSYKEVYDGLNQLAKKERSGKRKKTRSSARNGVHRPTIKKYMESIGWQWVAYTKFGAGCTVHLVKDELPAGPLVVSVSKHMTAVIDGVIYDIWDPQRDPPRQVYGVFMPPQEGSGI